MQKGKQATAGSKMLENFVAPFSATVVERLEGANVKIAGVVDAGEFGVSGLLKQGDGSFASLALTDAVNGVDVALFNDNTGVISQAAAAQGLYYIHPTYGTVSRYGLIPSVSSMDQIGVLCKSPDVGFRVLKIIAGYDEKDGVMTEKREEKGLEEKDWIASCARNDEVVKYPLQQCAYEYSKVLPQIMQILCCAELSNNISRYDGIKFGHRAKGYSGLRELYTKSRTEAFGEDVKLAAIVGAMVLSQENYSRYYDKAMRLRRLIKESLDFKGYDVLETDCPLLSRLCGFPSLTTPEKVFIANAGCEDVLETLCKSDDGYERLEGDSL